MNKMYALRISQQSSKYPCEGTPLGAIWSWWFLQLETTLPIRNPRSREQCERRQESILFKSLLIYSCTSSNCNCHGILTSYWSIIGFVSVEVIFSLYESLSHGLHRTSLSLCVSRCHRGVKRDIWKHQWVPCDVIFKDARVCPLSPVV